MRALDFDPNRISSIVPFEAIDISSWAHKARAYELYGRLRESAPVCRVLLPTREEAWLVARYEDVSRLLKDPRLVKDPTKRSLLHAASRLWPGAPKTLRTGSSTAWSASVVLI
jgi:cytochrome P450